MGSLRVASEEGDGRSRVRVLPVGRTDRTTIIVLLCGTVGGGHRGMGFACLGRTASVPIGLARHRWRSPVIA